MKFDFSSWGIIASNISILRFLTKYLESHWLSHQPQIVNFFNSSIGIVSMLMLPFRSKHCCAWVQPLRAASVAVDFFFTIDEIEKNVFIFFHGEANENEEKQELRGMNTACDEKSKSEREWQAVAGIVLKRRGKGRRDTGAGSHMNHSYSSPAPNDSHCAIFTKGKD